MTIASNGNQKADKYDWGDSKAVHVVFSSGGVVTVLRNCWEWAELNSSFVVSQNFQIFGYARSAMDDSTFRDMIAETLTCRVDAGCVVNSWDSPLAFSPCQHLIR